MADHRRICHVVWLLTVVTIGPSAIWADQPSLPEAAEAGNWAVVQQLISADTAQQAQADGATALHWAVFHDCASAVKQLLDAGADPDAMNEYRVSPLSLACELGHEASARVLIEAGAELESQRLGNATPLLMAARHGNAAMVKALIDAGAIVETKEQNGQTALMWAAAAGNNAAVVELLAAGAEPNTRTGRTDFSAFLLAARQGHLDVVETLLDAGVDANEAMKPKQPGGRQPRKGMSALLLAVESGHFELAIRLVDQGADPNDQRSGFGPLHALTWVRKTKLGDDPSGDPPPRGSGSIDSLTFASELVQRGAKVNLPLTDGKATGKAKMNTKAATPFLMASQTADLPLMKLLVELGADPELSNADNCTPLMACAGIGAVSVGEEPGTEPEVNAAVTWLLQKGQDVNAADKNSETAMHGAAYRNYPETVQLLAAAGADPKIWNRKNKFGWTPFDIALGKRPGSVKPSPPTTRALEEAKRLVPE